MTSKAKSDAKRYGVSTKTIRKQKKSTERKVNRTKRLRRNAKSSTSTWALSHRK